MEKRYAIVRAGVIENIGLWDGVTEWAPPEGCTAIECPDAVGPGWTHEHGEWTAPEETVNG